MTRLDATFAALVAVQALHSVEEYVGRLWAVFPPAAFITGESPKQRSPACTFDGCFDLWERGLRPSTLSQ